MRTSFHHKTIVFLNYDKTESSLKFLDCPYSEQLNFHLSLEFYGERALGFLTYIGTLTNMEPFAVDEPVRLLRRSLILIGVDSTIEYRSVFLRFDLFWLTSFSVSLRRRFLDVDLATEY